MKRWPETRSQVIGERRMMQVYEEMALNKITGNRGEEDDAGL